MRTAHPAARRPRGPDELLRLARGPGAPATPGPVRRADTGCPHAGPACGAAVSAGERAASRGAEMAGLAGLKRADRERTPPTPAVPALRPPHPFRKAPGNPAPRRPPPRFPFRSRAEESVFCTYSYRFWGAFFCSS